jgi:hypothetical protein
MTHTPVKLGTIKAKDAPNVFGNSVWFRGADDLIWHMPLDRPAAAVNPQGLKTLSTPQPAGDGFVYFQGEGDTLIMMQQEFPHLYTVLEGCDCGAAPAAPNDGYVYFRTGMGKLARVSVMTDDFGTVTRYDVDCAFAPAVYIAESRAYAFFVDSSDGYKLNRLDLDQASPLDIDTLNYVVQRAPSCSNNQLYIVTSSHEAFEINPINKAGTKIASDVESAPTTSEIVDDGNVYWQTISDKLLMAPRSNISSTTELGETDAKPDAQGDGFVVFLGLDEYLYRVSTTPDAAA